MIKANELRIGNYVNHEQTTHLITCVNIDYSISVWVDTMINQEYLYQHQNNELKPIPLTEEWLLNFGFARHHGDYYNDVFMLKNVIDFETGRLFDAFEIKIYPNEIGSAQSIKGCLEISYVHQLQNLYFALTNEELTIKK